MLADHSWGQEAILRLAANWLSVTPGAPDLGAPKWTRKWEALRRVAAGATTYEEFRRLLDEHLHRRPPPSEPNRWGKPDLTRSLLELLARAASLDGLRDEKLNFVAARHQQLDEATRQRIGDAWSLAKARLCLNSLILRLKADAATKPMTGQQENR